MDSFIRSLSITDVSSENIELKSLYAGSAGVNSQCDCHCCDGCDAPDTVSSEIN
jgi:hypothetical protein